VREVECDLVLTAMVGAAGLPATLEAARLGRDIALANKETLVAAGGLVVPAARASGSRLLPVDSEHAGLWQCLAGVLGPDAAPPLVCPREVRRVTLTASGGPLRGLTREQIDAARPEAALRHPTWSMGRKVTIDSASLVNKALEIVEAHWLFGLPPERIEAVVHPQSLVHAWVEFEGGSVVAQVAPPDMRVPIQHALTWPERAASPARAIDPRTLSALTFEPVDTQRFPLIELGHRAIVDGGTAGAILSGANEAAVGAFLRADPPVTFGRMVGAVLDAYRSIKPGPLGSLEDFFRADARARAFVEERLAGAWAR
jgi:1-deoxy-D-xylulose-5-phosphate reductoisomerase